MRNWQGQCKKEAMAPSTTEDLNGSDAIATNLTFQQACEYWKSDIECAQMLSGAHQYQRSNVLFFTYAYRTIQGESDFFLVLHSLGHRHKHRLVAKESSRGQHFVRVVHSSARMFPLLRAGTLAVSEMSKGLLHSEFSSLIQIFRDFPLSALSVVKYSIAGWSPNLDSFRLTLCPEAVSVGAGDTCTRVRRFTGVIDTSLPVEELKIACQVLIRIALTLTDMLTLVPPTLVYLTVYSGPRLQTVVDMLPLIRRESVMFLERCLLGLEPTPCTVKSTAQMVESVAQLVRCVGVRSDFLLCTWLDVLDAFRQRNPDPERSPFPVPVAHMVTFKRRWSLDSVGEALQGADLRLNNSIYTWPNRFVPCPGCYFNTEEVARGFEHREFVLHATNLVQRRQLNKRIHMTIANQYSVVLPYVAKTKSGIQLSVQSNTVPLTPFEQDMMDAGEESLLFMDHQFIDLAWSSPGCNVGHSAMMCIRGTRHEVSVG